MKLLMSILLVLFLTGLVGPGGAMACTGVPDLDFSIVWKTFEGLCSLVITPEGTGAPLTQARTPDGTIVDATIHLTLNSNCITTEPVANFPAEDMWLESTTNGVNFCLGGNLPDGPTDIEGNTQWSQPLLGGGWDDVDCRVVVNGLVTPAGNTLNLIINSPDSNGDGEINIVDVYEFAQDFFGPYRFRADLAFDGVINLSDLSILGASLGQSCP